MEIKDLKEINTVSLTDLPFLWEQNSILILLIDLDAYNGFDTEHLDISEKKYLETLQTSYFKKRYIISRLVLKEVIFSLFREHFPFKNQALYEIHTYKDRHGRIHVTFRGQKNFLDIDYNERISNEGILGKRKSNGGNHEELHLCISYTGSIICLALSKVELGIDIELKRPLSLQRLSGYLDPFKLDIEDRENGLDENLGRNPFGPLVTLTLKEAYCKFSNIDMLSNLSKNPSLNSLFYLAFILNDKYLLSLVADKSFYANTQDALQLISINYLKTSLS